MGKFIDKKNCDFSGYVTSFGKLCRDGRTILDMAFDDDDGKEVPLVYMHNHTDIENVLGHGILEKRKSGMYGYFDFNATPMGRIAKEQVRNGDLGYLSIWANDLAQDSNRNVSHGCIREVSLVLAGANPGAYIDNVSLSHSAESNDDMVYYCDRHITSYISHSFEDDEESDEIDNYISEELAHSDEGKTLADVWDTMDEDQKYFVAYMMQKVKEDPTLTDDLQSIDKEPIKHDGVGGEGAGEGAGEGESEADSESEADDGEETKDLDPETEEDREDVESDDPYDIASNFTNEQSATCNAIAYVIENGVESVSKEEAEAILDEYENMTDKQKAVVKQIIETYLSNKKG